MRRFILGVLASMALLSCKNDLEIYTDPVDLPYIYGVVTSNQDEHYVKVTKTFQKLAKDVTFDDLYYHDDSIKVYIEEYENGTFKRDFLGVPVQKNDKQSGQFTFPDNKYYHFTNAKLVGPSSTSSKTYTYGIRAELSSGAIVRNLERFPMNNNITIKKPKINKSSTQVGISFVNNVGLKSPYLVEWEHKDGGIESVDLILHIEESNHSTGEIDTLEIPVSIYNELPVVDKVSAVLEFSSLFLALDNKLVKSSNLSRRILGTERDGSVIKTFGIGLDFWSSSKDLSTYNAILFSQDGISQDKPNYTNLENSLGIFTSRSNRTVAMEKKNLFFEIDVIDSLSCSSRLFDYNFARYYFDNTGNLVNSVLPNRCEQ